MTPVSRSLLRRVLLAGLIAAGACRDTNPCDPMPRDGSCSPLHDGDRTRRCFSEDAAAAGGKLPDYPGVEAPASELGEPLFSFHRNQWSSFGRCTFEDLSVDEVSHACNPSWTDEQIAAVCDEFEGCLRLDETNADDCVRVDGVWRAVRGSDVADPQDWIVDNPGTRQDPDLVGCTEWATVSGVVDDARLRDCVRQLTAADQRDTAPSSAPPAIGRLLRGAQLMPGPAAALSTGLGGFDHPSSSSTCMPAMPAPRFAPERPRLLERALQQRRVADHVVRDPARCARQPLGRPARSPSKSPGRAAAWKGRVKPWHHLKLFFTR